MKQKIAQVLNQLTQESEFEKTKQRDIALEDRMLAITEDTGRFFNLLLRGKNFQKILEIGMSVGYSTLWFADAILDNGGTITTIEQNSSKIDRAKRNFEKAGISNVEVIQGNATDVLSNLYEKTKSNQLEKFDFVFIDADKENVIEYFDYAWNLVNSGGMIAVDNILYPEKFRPEMKKLIEHIKTKPNVITVTIPIGNGEELSLKTA